MLTVKCEVDGHTVGEMLQGEPEDLAHALLALSEDFPDDLGEGVAYQLAPEEVASVKTLLRNLLDAIDEASEE